MESHLQDFATIQGRLLKLERQNRRFKQLGAAALIAAVSLLIMGQASPKKTVEANELILRDSSGNIRARLSMYVPKGAAPSVAAASQLVFFDEKGKQRVVLDGGNSWGIPGLSLYDGQEHLRANFIESDAFGMGSALMLQDEHGNLQTRLNGLGVLATLVQSTRADASEFRLQDGHDNTRARLFVTEKHTENMTIPGMDKPVPMTFNPSPVLALYDEKGKAQVDRVAYTFGFARGAFFTHSLHFSFAAHLGLELRDPLPQFILGHPSVLDRAAVPARDFYLVADLAIGAVAQFLEGVRVTFQQGAGHGSLRRASQRRKHNFSSQRLEAQVVS